MKSIYSASNIFKWLILLLVLLGQNDLYAQNKLTIHGTVVDENKHPLAGVTVSVFSGGKMVPVTQTNEKGAFTIEAAQNTRVLFEHISYAQKEIIVKGGAPLNITLEAGEAKYTDEVVIVGYQRRTKETLTGSVTRILADEIQDVPVSNIEELLQGKVAGLNIQQTTGAPGFRGGASIRGLSQIMVQGSGQEAYLTPQSPLYVIDGIPVDANAGFEYGLQSLGPGTSPLSLIPPEDVESIDVMKDAEATALYGSKGANGVIVITTRRGNSKKPLVRYAGSYFINFAPELRNTIGGKAERDYRINMILNSLNYDEIRKISNAQFLSDSLNPFYNNSTDWQGLYYSTTYNHSHNMSVSGGNQKLNYKTNLNYYSEKGVVKNTGFDRYAVSMNINFNPSPKLQTSGYLSTGLGKKLKGSGNGLTDVGAGSNISSSLLPGPSYFNNVGQFTSAMYSDNDAKTYNANFYLNVLYELFPNVQLSTNTSYDYTSDLEDRFTPALANENRSKLYGFTGRKTNLYNRSMISYSNALGKKEDHNLYATVFSEVTVSNNKNSIINRSNGPNDVYRGPFGYNSFYSGVTGIPEGGISEVHSVGLAANAQYNYQRKYVVNFNYRMDGNSYAGLKERWAKSPSVGLRWNFNREDWLKGIKWLDFGDLRFSYGINLRPTTNVYASLGWYDVKGNYNNVTRITPHLGFMPNPYLKPEKVEQFNFGLDLSVLNNRLSLTFDAYSKTVYDMLYNRPLSTSTGFQNTFSNEASLYNYGYEIALSIRPFPATSKINWTINLNTAINRDVLLQLPGGAMQSLSSDGTVINRVGYGALSNFMYLSEGVYRTDNDVPVDPVTGLRFKNTSGEFFGAGDMKFFDVNGDYVVDVTDLQVAGSPTPRITGGFSSYFNWKNYSINLNGTILFGRDIINNSLYERLSNLKAPFDANTLVNLAELNFWKKEGDVAKYPNPNNYLINTGSFRGMQTLYQEDGSFIKLNAVTFGYNFDKKLLERIKVNAVRCYATITNLFMISAYSGPNPEAVNDLGRDYLGTYPISRSLSLGLNVEF